MKSPEPAGAVARFRIALVDDEPNILSALRRELRDPSFELSVFEDPVKAQEALTSEEYCLIISDNLMPNLTGLELLAKVKDARPRTRRILLTGRTDANRAVDAFNGGTIHRFLHKPWKKEELLDVIREEMKIYQAGKQEADMRVHFEAQARQRGERLVSTIRELKQTQTQLVLLEDATNVEALKAGESLRNLSFLVVDEQEVIRSLLLGALNGAGIAKAHGEPNGHAALEYLRTAPQVDVVLAEWTLQGMDGIAFLKQLRQSESPSKRALFILMATADQRQIVEHAQKSGIDGYLVKPFRLALLFDTVAKLAPQSEERKAAVTVALQKCTVLVANAHPASRHGIEKLLAEAGIPDVHSATFGPGAMTLMREKNPEIVIYDINVSDPGWEELRERFRLDPRSPALLITGVLASHEDWELMRRHGVSNFLPGPFRGDELLQALRTIWPPAK